MQAFWKLLSDMGRGSDILVDEENAFERRAVPVDGRPPIEGRPLNEGRPLKDGRPLNPLPRDLRVGLLLASSLLTRDAPSDWREFICEVDNPPSVVRRIGSANFLKANARTVNFSRKKVQRSFFARSPLAVAAVNSSFGVQNQGRGVPRYDTWQISTWQLIQLRFGWRKSGACSLCITKYTFFSLLNNSWIKMASACAPTLTATPMCSARGKASAQRHCVATGLRVVPRSTNVALGAGRVNTSRRVELLERMSKGMVKGT